jgi:hypothetical protein
MWLLLQAEESALVRALAYFDEVLGWTIGDLNYLLSIEAGRRSMNM